MRHFTIIAIFVLYVLTIASQSYIYKDIQTCLRGKTKKAGIFAFWILSLGSLSLLTITIVLQISDYPDLYNVMWILFSYLTLFVPSIVYCLLSAIGRLFKWQRNGRRMNYLALAGFLFASLLFITMWWGAFFTRNEIVVRELDYKNSSLPESFENYRVVQFSDAHVGSWGNDTTFVSKVVNKINSLSPDLVLFTGDIVNRETVELAPFIKTLSRIKAKDGVYSVLGNHDYGDYAHWDNISVKEANLELLKSWQRQMGWTMLNNDFAYIANGKDSIVLIGVENWGEPPFKQYGELAKAYPDNQLKNAGLYDNKFKILLTHNPEHWNQEVTSVSNIDLTLSGHTHAMQMAFNWGKIRFSPAKFKYPLWSGFYNRVNQKGDTLSLYVNEGCGEVGIPARYGNAYPEITLIKLKR